MEQPRATEEAPGAGGFAALVMRGAGFTAAGYGLAQLLNLFVYIVLSRLLTPSDFGVYAAATVLVAVGILVTESGLMAALIHREGEIEEAASTTLVATVATGVVSILGGLAVAPLLGLIFDSSQVTALALASSGFIFCNVIQVVPNALLQRRFAVVRRVIVDPLEVIFFGAAAIIAAAAGMGPWSLVIGQYVGLLSGAALSFLFARWRPDFSLVSFSMWRELVAYGRHIFYANTIQRIGEQSLDTLIIGKALGTASLGQFKYAFRISSMPFQATAAASGYALFPALARIRDDRTRIADAFIRSTRWLALIGFPAGLLLLPLGPGIAGIVFGDVWIPAGYAAAAMCLYAGASAVTSGVSETLKATGTVRPLTPLFATGTGVTAVAMVALSPLGLTAAAGSVSIGAVVAAVYGLALARRATGVSVRAIWAEVWPPALAGSIMALAILPLDRFVLDPATRPTLEGLALLAAEGLACAAVFAIALRVLSPRTFAEATGLLRGLIARRRRRRAALPGPEAA